MNEYVVYLQMGMFTLTVILQLWHLEFEKYQKITVIIYNLLMNCVDLHLSKIQECCKALTFFTF